MADDRDDIFDDAQRGESDRWTGSEGGSQGNFDAPKSGSSAVKVLLIVLAVLVIGAVLCCGGAGLYFYLNPPVSTTTNADEIRQKTAEIVSIEIPPEFSPEVGMDMNLFGVMTMQMAVYTAGGNGTLLVAAVQAPQGADQAQMEQQLRQSMQQQNLGQQLTINNSETRKIEVNGAEVDFLFSTATNTADGSEWRQVTGAFPGKNGTAFILLQQPSSAFDEEEVTGMLQSISTQ